MIAALILIGAPGSGKSSVLDALATLLEIDGVGHSAIESEQLARGFPLLPGDVWTEQLAAVLKLQRDAGRSLFLIVATTETAHELEGVLAAAAAELTLVVCLAAPADELARRLERRESDRWPGKRALIAHARSLAATVPRLDRVDAVIDTSGHSAEDIATEIYEQMRARGICAVRDRPDVPPAQPLRRAHRRA